MSQIFTYAIILVALFVIVGIIMAVSAARMRRNGQNVQTTTAPIPDREQSNKHTRKDNGTDAMYNDNAAPSINERERNRS
ncbi:MAG: hypothetical protein NVS2B12_14770 [Ktedonobacteraceae bacterium]